MKLSTLKNLVFVLCSAAIVNSCNQRKQELLEDRGLSFAENFKSLPYFKKGVQTYQYSSTDPKEDQFNDYGHWLRNDPDSNAVLADIKGPGCIYRIWSTGNEGNSDRLKIYLDGHQRPDVDETFNDFHNRPPLRDKPQVGSGAGDNYLAWWSYQPIPFQRSCRIVRKGNFRPFYNITYHAYTDTQNVKSWNGKEDLKKLEHMWSNPEKDPKPTEGNITKKVHTDLAPHQNLSVMDYAGKGYISSLKISNYLKGNNFRLKIYWDNEMEPSVDAPVKWFFGSVDNGGDVKALGIGTIHNNGYCYYPMPFWKNVKIELVNNSDTVARNIDVEIQYNESAYQEEAAGYFHAKANEVAKPGKKYSCLTTRGHGHVIGMAKRMPAGGHACEADEIFFIDNRKFPDIYGTGEEDYANCAWWKNTYNTYPTHGHIGNDCYYRIHYPDIIVYEQGLDMEFESWENYYIASVVWYYEKDDVSLLLTDSLNILNKTAETQHHYTASGETWTGIKKGQYPGKRIYTDSVRDDGRAFSGFSEFSVSITRENKGVRLRSRTENKNFQGVNVFVDGTLVHERPWFVSKNNFEAIWVDTDFEIPGQYTQGKQKITIKLEHIPGNQNWIEYNYHIYSYLR
jgi:Protein of unknown function (DUF2961)